MLIKDEIKLLHQAIPSKKEAGNRKKRLIALREVRHMLDEVSARRTILCQQNEDVRSAISSMKEALASMPKSVQDERAKLMSRHTKSKARGAMRMANENIRESLYSMNLTISSIPIVVAASTASGFSQQALYNTLLASVQQHPGGHHDPNMRANIPILPQITTCPPVMIPSIVGCGLSIGHQ